jgi:DNA-binding NtrC family response regulator
MRRPVFIIAEPEPEQALSARKLVIETAKFNVITAHSGAEMEQSLKDFPLADAVIIHNSLAGGSAARFVKMVKSQTPAMPVIVLSPSGNGVKGADHAVSSHEPEELVILLRRLFGDPRKIG